MSSNKDIAAADTLTINGRGVFWKYAGAVGLDEETVLFQFFNFLRCLVLFVDKRGCSVSATVLFGGINQVGL